MNRVRQSVFARFFLLPFALLLWLSACHKWVPLEPPVQQAIEESGPGTVRITLADGSRVTVKEPHVSGDSLVGAVEESTWERGKLRWEDRMIEIPLGSVQQIEERRANTPATVVTVLGVTLGAMVVVGLISCGTNPNQIGC